MAAALAGWLPGKDAVMNNRSKLFYLVAIGWIVVIMLMAALVLRNTDTPAIEHKTTPDTPTHLVGPEYAEGLVTEYHTINSVPIRRVFTVVVDGVEYQAYEDEDDRYFHLPIKPGYYQVGIGSIDSGTITVILSGDGEGSVVYVVGCITSERLVAQSE
jgi:hypothetical protein